MAGAGGIMESSYTYKPPIEFTHKLDFVEDLVLEKADKNRPEMVNDDDMVSAASSELSVTGSKDASSLEDLKQVFYALREDFSHENRNHIVAVQREMLEHYRLGDINRRQSDDNDLEMESSGVIGNHAIRSIADRQRSVIPLPSLSPRADSLFPEFGYLFDDDDDDEFDFEADFYARMQLELMRRFGLIDEEMTFLDQRSMHECQVCYDCVRLTVRPCCQKAVCDSCLQQYVETQIADYGNLRIECPNPDCKSQVYSDEIRSILRTKSELRERYDRWIVDLNGDPNRKTCPRCCHITEIDPAALADQKVGKYGLKKECMECHLEWCFPCHAPWHEGVSCKKYRTGDVLLKKWARERIRFGECNAQQCPKCKVSFYDIILYSFFISVLHYFP
jgi:hypothetical protein